jgi:hypothetical protein
VTVNRSRFTVFSLVMQSPPEQVARYTVERNGGEYETDVADLLGLFGRENLTDAAREEVRTALQSVDIGTDPDLLVAQRADPIRLFVLDRQAAWHSPPPQARSAWRPRFRPRTWKGWLAYGVVALVILSAIFGDSNEPQHTAPASQRVDPTSQSSDSAAVREARREARRERVRLRREREQLKREQAAARRARARVRRARAAARRERELQRAAAAEQAAPEPDPQVESAAANCHPSYDPCLDPNASDYDCEGGSGDGPMYTGFVTVTGPDDYGLDSDGDGTGCES